MKMKNTIEELRANIEYLEEINADKLTRETMTRAAHILMKMQWIKTTDRLPDDGQEVLTYYRDTSCGKEDEFDQVDLLSYFKEGHIETFPRFRVAKDGFYVLGDGWHRHVDIITHWMPLPEPPK